ncbi:MAG: GNAT family protein [Rhodanobacter sp.]
MDLHTSRLLIDALRADDADTLFGYRSDPQVSRYQGWCPDSVDAAQQFIHAQDGVLLDTPETWCQRALRLHDSGELIGDVGLHFTAADDATVELGISLAPRYQGQGFATEALRGVLGYVFETLHKHRVFGSVDPRNEPSMRLLVAIGMRQEAHFHESYRCADGWADDVIFAMLEREWSAAALSERANH